MNNDLVKTPSKKKRVRIARQFIFSLDSEKDADVIRYIESADNMTDNIRKAVRTMISSGEV